MIPREDLIKRKEPFNIGRLMTILSVKHGESPSLRKLKTQIVFRGDGIRDGGNLAVLPESKLKPRRHICHQWQFSLWFVVESQDYSVRSCPCLPSIDPGY